MNKMDNYIRDKSNKKVPVGVKIIAILNYLLSAIAILFALAGIIGGIAFISNGSSFAQNLFGSFGSGTLGDLITGEAGRFYTSFGFIALIIGILSFIVALLLIIFGINLWKGKNWARIWETILVSLWVIVWAIELFRGAFLNLIIIIPSLIVIFYLIFSSRVKEHFA